MHEDITSNIQENDCYFEEFLDSFIDQLEIGRFIDCSEAYGHFIDKKCMKKEICNKLSFVVMVLLKVN